MGEVNLRVVGEGSRKKESAYGTVEWARERCEHARMVAANLDRLYTVELGAVLWELYTVPAENNPGSKPVYTLLGYTSFEDFCERGVGIHRRKGSSLRAIYYRLYVDLKDLDPEIRDGVAALGWTKSRELVRVMTYKNAAAWYEFAKTHTFTDVEARVQEQVNAAKKMKSEKEDGKVSTSIAGASFSDEEAPGFEDAPAPKRVNTPGATADEDEGVDLLPTADDEPENDAPAFDPAIAEMEGTDLTRRTFAFHPAQLEVVETALEMAAKQSGSDVASHNLSLICAEFAASNDATPRTKVTKDFRLKTLANLERVLGVRLLAVDTKSGEPVFANSFFQDAVSK